MTKTRHNTSSSRTEDESEDRDNFLSKLRNLSEPKKKIVFWLSLSLIAALCFLLWAPRLLGTIRRIGEINTGEMIGENVEFEKLKREKEGLDEGFKGLSQNKAIIEALEQSETEEEFIKKIEKLKEEGKVDIDVEELKSELGIEF